MNNYDDIFAGRSSNQHSREFVFFDKESWVVQKRLVAR